MHLRFSLRTLFIVTTVAAGLCLWFILPSLTARRFLGAVTHEDYNTADKFFLNADDRFLADWSDKRWAFRSAGALVPLTFGQFCRSQRAIRIELTYFQFDQNFKRDVLVVATPFGLKKPQMSSAERVGIIYDGRGGSAF